MNKKDHDFGTLDLENIIREFSDMDNPVKLEGEELAFRTGDLQEVIALMDGQTEEAAEPAQQPEEPVEEPEVPAEEPAAEEPPVEEKCEEEEPVPEETAEEIPEPTIRLSPIAQAAVSDPEESEEAPEEMQEPTVRLESISEATVAQEEEPVVEVTAEEPAEEEAADQSAPALEDPELGEEYEDDDDEIEVNFPHLPPLIFRPRSRLGELKRQLVAGPEKRYYELAEIGVGKVQIAMLLCLVVILVSGAAALLYNAGQVSENRIRLMVFSQVLAMLMGGLLGSQQMIDGISDLFHRKFTLNTLLAVSFLACCADSVFCFMERRVPLCAAFTLEVLMSLWSAYHKRTTEMGQMDTMRKAVRLDGIVKREDYYESRPGFLRKEGQVEEFMDHYDEASGPEKVQRAYAVLSLLASIGIAVVAGLFHGVTVAVQIFSTTLLAAVPASMFISLTRPAAILERKLHRLGTVICGWSGIKALCGKGVLPVSDYDLFPAGATKMNGVKFYGDRDPEEVIAFTTALMSANGGSLAPIFEQLLNSRGGTHYNAVNMQHYGNGGIGAEVCGEPVLLGTLEFLKDMGVEAPEGIMVKQAVYVSIDGELSGLFALTYTRTKFAAGGLSTLHHYRRVAPIVLAKDFMLTAPFLKEKFGIHNRRMIFAGRDVREELAQKEPAEDAASMALMTQEGLAPVAYAITGAKALRTACRLGVTVHIIGGLLGMLIMLALAILGAVHLLTPVHILLYQLVWMIPGLLITMWPRTI